MSTPENSTNTDGIQAWLVAKLSERLGLESHEIDVREPLASYGLGSTEAVSLAGELAEWLGRQLSPALVYEYPTIEALARHLAGPPDVPAPATGPGHDRQANNEPIAIIGLGCRFPGANDPAAFWRLLHDGVDAIREVPADRFDQHAFYDPDPTAPGKMNTRWGGFLEEVDRFDTNFFGISPREALRMDPQQRLLLEVTWEALQDAGQVPERLAGTQTGVFIGVATNDYGRLQWNDLARIDAYAGTGNALSIAANRISYLFDFRGPSIALDTACSSSLVAVHLACCSLRNGESTLALAGGVNLILSPAIAINFTKAGAMAPDGRCKAFDARANGYVRSEGAGVVVLKPLSKALTDGDPIYAVIRGSAVNQDGRSNGLMAPNPAAQEAVLREAYRQAGVSPGQVQYVEAHGTGTLLGDPIEAQALGAVLGVERPPERPCALGSVKTNLGHLEAAAGIAGLIKVALALRHQEIPPSLHFEEPNPHIPFAELPLRVQTALGPWPTESGPALAGVQFIRLRRHQRACGSASRASGHDRNGGCGTENRRPSATAVGASSGGPPVARARLPGFPPHPRGRFVVAGCLLHGQRAARSPRPPARRDRRFAGAPDREPGSLFAGRGASRPFVWPQAFRAPAETCLCVSRAGQPMVWHGTTSADAGSRFPRGHRTLRPGDAAIRRLVVARRAHGHRCRPVAIERSRYHPAGAVCDASRLGSPVAFLGHRAAGRGGPQFGRGRGRLRRRCAELRRCRPRRLSSQPVVQAHHRARGHGGGRTFHRATRGTSWSATKTACRSLSATVPPRRCCRAIRPRSPPFWIGCSAVTSSVAW